MLNMSTPYVAYVSYVPLSLLPSPVCGEKPNRVARDVRVRAVPSHALPEWKDAGVSELRALQGGHADLHTGCGCVRAPPLPGPAAQGVELHGTRTKVSRSSDVVIFFVDIDVGAVFFFVFFY